jgi:hypothetical protein
VTVTAGDDVTINWEAQDPYTTLALWPVNTTDYNISQSQPVTTQNPATNGKNELTYTAPVSGVMPTMFSVDGCYGGATGPYDFTVSVEHAVRLAVPRIGVLRHHTAIAVGVHTPDGTPITDPSLKIEVQVKSGSRWLNVGTGAPVNGVAHVHATLPTRLRGKKVHLRAQALGPSYTTEVSAAATSRVA